MAKTSQAGDEEFAMTCEVLFRCLEFGFKTHTIEQIRTSEQQARLARLAR
jgi:hypothetical protein